MPSRNTLRSVSSRLSTDVSKSRPEACITELVSYPPDEDNPDSKHSSKLDKLYSQHYVPTLVLIMLPSLVLMYSTSCFGRFLSIGLSSFVSTFEASSRRFRSYRLVLRQRNR